MKKNNKLLRLIIAGTEQSLRGKMFIILNILMLLGMLVYTNFQTGKEIFHKITNKPIKEDEYNIIIKDETSLFKNVIKKKLLSNMKCTNKPKEKLGKEDIVVEITRDNKEVIKAVVTSNQFIKANSYNVIVESLKEVKEELVKKELNINEKDLNKIKSDVNIERKTLEVNNSNYNKYSGVITIANFVLYFILIFITSSIASTIGMEKISRATEYMLTGISDKVYLWYNIIQCNLIFILQILFSILYFLFGNIVSKILNTIVLKMDPTKINLATNNLTKVDRNVVILIVYLIVQGLLVATILSIVQAVITSKVNNVNDVSNSTMLTIFIVIFGTMIIPNFIGSTTTVNIFLKVISFLPVLSLSMVPKLYLLELVPKTAMLFAFIITLITLILCVIIGSKIFKKGLLEAGKISNKDTNIKEKDANQELLKIKIKNIIFKVAICLLLYFLIGNVLNIAITFMKDMFNNTYKMSEDYNYIFDILNNALVLLIPYIYLKTSIELFNKGKKKKKINKVKYVMFGIAGCVITQILMIILESKINLNNDLMNVVVYQKTDSIVSNILLVIMLAIAPAILEELLFRKGIVGISKNISPRFAILLSGIAFGIMHGNFSQTILAFFVGSMLAYIYIKTESLVPCIIIHFLNNLTATLEIIFPESKIAYGYISVMVVIGAIGAVLFIFDCIKNKKEIVLEKSDEKIPNVLNIIATNYYAVFAVVLYLSMMIYIQTSIKI